MTLNYYKFPIHAMVYSHSNNEHTLKLELKKKKKKRIGAFTLRKRTLNSLNFRPSLALHGHLIWDTLQFANAFSSCIFNTVGRTGNFVAHHLARRAISTHDLNVWMEEVPPDILQFVQADLTALIT